MKCSPTIIATTNFYGKRVDFVGDIDGLAVIKGSRPLAHMEIAGEATEHLTGEDRRGRGVGDVSLPKFIIMKKAEEWKEDLEKEQIYS